MGRLFGTDGIRGVANSELTCELALSIGRAAAFVLCKDFEKGTEENKKDKKGRISVVIGKDTRRSSDMLEAALVAGLCSAGVDAVLLGVVPTPAVPFLGNKLGAGAGIMISASHNPFEYNGIKMFNSEGYKLSDELEEEIEAIILDSAETVSAPIGDGVGSVTQYKRAVDDYVTHLLSTISVSLRGMKLLVDCANGSASATAKPLLNALDADCEFINCDPDGVNINENCGSTHVENLSEIVQKKKFFAALAFDGDADRFLAVDELGNVIDGDKIMAAISLDMKNKGELKDDAAVVTVMSNLGLYRFFEDNGIKTVTTQVGDRYVLEEMEKNDYSFGGEQSGHIIFKSHATTGDGQLTAIKFLAMCREQGIKLSVAGALMERFPQVRIDVKATREQKDKYLADKGICERIKKLEDNLGKEGRILVRPSGTEPLIRVMIEGKDFDEINKIAARIADDITDNVF